MNKTIVLEMNDLDNNLVRQGDDILIFNVRAKVCKIRRFRGELIAHCTDVEGNKIIGYSEEMFLVRRADK